MQLHARQSIEITINGEASDTRAATLAELVADLGYGEGQVATALNGDFVARAARAETRLAPGDKIEIVAPRQGG
jgi:sulfur carrier protein